VSSEDVMSVYVSANMQASCIPLLMVGARVVYMTLMAAQTRLRGNLAARLGIVPWLMRVPVPRRDVLADEGRRGSAEGKTRVLVEVVVCLESDHSSWRWEVSSWAMYVSEWWRSVAAEVALARMLFRFAF
jgi:hypothetical protein